MPSSTEAADKTAHPSRNRYGLPIDTTRPIPDVLNTPSPASSDMTLDLNVEGRTIAFRLDWKHWRWHSLVELKEGAFPLITTVQGKRYELYSDGTFAEVEKTRGP